jgi:flavin reductase (DIM6/NTAB) family NADH-FMN oxidoreductase RutF
MKQSLGAKTLAVPTPVWLVGTFDEDERPNIMTAAWGGICCSRPPCVQVSLREATYSHGNIKKRKSFTINIPSDEYWREADYAGIVSGRDFDKITDLEWSVVKSGLVDAPYIDQCRLVIECRLKKTVELGLHTMFIGEIMDVKADLDAITDGKPDISRISPIIFSPGESGYFSIGGKLSKAFQQRSPPRAL